MQNRINNQYFIVTKYFYNKECSCVSDNFVLLLLVKCAQLSCQVF